MRFGPVALTLQISPELDVTLNLDPASVARLREGLATVAQLEALASRVHTLEAGRNVRVTLDENTNVLRLDVVGSVRSYTAATASRPLGEEDNGCVVEVSASSPVTLTVSQALGKGFACVVRQVGTAAVTVAPVAPVTFLGRPPAQQAVSSTAQWQDILVEGLSPTVFRVTSIPAA